MLAVTIAIFSAASAAWASKKEPEAPHRKTIEEATKGWRRFPGLFTLYWDDAKDRLLLELDRLDAQFIYVNWLATGLGNNEIGLDRGQPGEARVVQFERHGNKVFLVQPNLSFRAASSNPDERLAAREAFAQSVLWGFEVEAETAKRVLVDATKFYLRDARNVAAELKKNNVGTFTVDASRSAIYLPRTKSFPDNTEVEASLTLCGEPSGTMLADVVPDPRCVSLRQHHSFVRLPDGDYTPRTFDPRAGFFSVDYFDFAAPLAERLDKHLLTRHRLRKKDAHAAVSDPVRPLVYYVDRGAPEPIRSALVEGASWWNQAFEAAGYRDAFQVKLLPEGADPLDVRYNVIQWVHRSTRGWAYGSSIVDPRTGEIIKGHVTMDSQRCRQVYRIAEALLASYEEGKAANPEIERMVLARMRQLSAHEVGHTLGLGHNFAASTRGRASVMDYPHPLVELRGDGALDVSQAYATGIGAWDKVAITYGYQDFPAGSDEKKGLNEIIAKSIADGLLFITDEDARPLGSAHPLAHLWDNGVNAVDELERVLKVRSRALETFSDKNIRPGRPLSDLEDLLVLVYLFHRYQVEAAAKEVGGLDYRYAVRGDHQLIVETVAAAEQERALATLLKTLQPQVLAVPESVLRLLPPRAYGSAPTRELFKGRASPAFDALAAPEAAANVTVTLLLEPARAARLLEQHARNPKIPAFDQVVNRLIEASWKATPANGYAAEIQRVVDDVVLYHLMALAAEEKAATQVRAIAFLKLQDLAKWLSMELPNVHDVGRRAHHAFAISRIEKFQKAPGQPALSKPVEPPPGQPIGAAACDCSKNPLGVSWTTGK
jgi:hypothetical protein